MIGDFESCIPVLFDPFKAYCQYPWHLSEDHERYSVFIDKEGLNVREMKVDVVERLMKASMKEKDDMRRYIAYELFLGLMKCSLKMLLVPENNNIPIVEDSKTVEVFLPGAEEVKVRDLDHFLQLLQIGEANRHAANTKMNTKSSRSHAILMINVRKLTHGKVDNEVSTMESNTKNDLQVDVVVPTLRKSKLLIVDLAGSERIDKSGSEGHHDKGTARTSLIVTIGPSARHHSETASTIMYEQRAIKIVNMLKLKEEFDYESLCWKLENRVDFLTTEIERQQKLRGDYKEVQIQNDIDELAMKLKEMCQLHEKTVNAYESLKTEYEKLLSKKTILNEELRTMKEKNSVEEKQRKYLEDECAKLKRLVPSELSTPTNLQIYLSITKRGSQYLVKEPPLQRFSWPSKGCRYVAI
ncbi:hypothetical protein GIB67_022428 [Kingdonia uniflora]|uniref:Kinesin-like protein n=1 Tax=Kingdonia uniflora TaxID=39325 RepID=A0A7J7MUI7_9MAGN|nr:hypothetical protein GIB67_022428 [Kingdonia uniflora]